jgi:glycosyltransferase involved in cell wall biosynthesis
MIKFTAQMIVKNEDQWVWFAINSVLPYCQRMLIFDTGSMDKTVEIIKSINSPKIIFEEKGEVDPQELVLLRQEQLKRTETDWFLILDGDEIWPPAELETVLHMAEKSPKNIKAVYNWVRNCIGDVYHYLPDSAGRYEIARDKGNLNIRLIRKTLELKVVGEYPLEYYGDEAEPLQNQTENLKGSKAWVLHTTFLKRSSLKKQKVSGSFGRKKFPEKGLLINKKELPEILFKSDLKGIPDPLKKRGFLYEAAAFITTPLINCRRKVI